MTKLVFKYINDRGYGFQIKCFDKVHAFVCSYGYGYKYRLWEWFVE
jgi:hypothetical protein